MEQWKVAFKQIFGKTPTKTDCSIAPKSVRGNLLVTPEKQSNCPLPKSSSRKRKQLFLKPNEATDEEFASPIKKQRRPKMTSNPSTLSASANVDSFEQIEGSSNSSVNLQQILRPPAIDPFLSPVKNWTGFLASPSRSTQKRLAPISPSALLKTPSPARLLQRPIMFTNIGNLLTPEKATKSSFEEEEENEEEKMELNENQREEMDEMEIEEEKKPKKTKKKMAKPKKEKPNYISLNLRRRQFAPISKFRGKGKRRWSGKSGGIDWNRRRGLFRR